MFTLRFYSTHCLHYPQTPAAPLRLHSRCLLPLCCCFLSSSYALNRWRSRQRCWTLQIRSRTVSLLHSSIEFKCVFNKKLNVYWATSSSRCRHRSSLTHLLSQSTTRALRENQDPKIQNFSSTHWLFFVISQRFVDPNGSHSFPEYLLFCLLFCA